MHHKKVVWRLVCVYFQITIIFMSDLCLADAIIESIVETDTCTRTRLLMLFLSLKNIPVSDQSIAKLNSIFPETLVVAALDLVDRENSKDQRLFGPVCLTHMETSHKVCRSIVPVGI